MHASHTVPLTGAPRRRHCSNPDVFQLLDETKNIMGKFPTTPALVRVRFIAAASTSVAELEWSGQHGVIVLQLFVLRFNCQRPLVVLFGLIELREAE